MNADEKRIFLDGALSILELLNVRMHGVSDSQFRELLSDTVFEVSEAKRVQDMELMSELGMMSKNYSSSKNPSLRLE